MSHCFKESYTIHKHTETRKTSCRWQTRATLAKRLHGLCKSSGVVSCITIACLSIACLWFPISVLYSNFFFFFFSLRHITDICLQLVSLLLRIPRICCSSAVVSFCLSYVSQSSCLPERLAITHHVRRRTCQSHLRFRWFNVLMIQRFSLTRFRTSELLTFAVQLIFSIFLHIHISI